MAIPEKGSRIIPIHLYTGDHACHKCRTQEGIKPGELLTDAAKDAARAAMQGKEPDFARAFLEWMTIP